MLIFDGSPVTENYQNLEGILSDVVEDVRRYLMNPREGVKGEVTFDERHIGLKRTKNH